MTDLEKNTDKKETIAEKADNFIGTVKDHFCSAFSAGTGVIVAVTADAILQLPPITVVGTALATGFGISLYSADKIRPVSFFVGGLSTLILSFALASALKNDEAPTAPVISKDPIVQMINAPTQQAPKYKD
jgi:hypothetical protein